MPVTIHTSTKRPDPIGGQGAKGADDLLPYRHRVTCKRILQTSFTDIPHRTVVPSDNGFVNAALQAYSNHHNLTVRPEDVWFAILSQLSFYINANAEELRSLFVSHEGSKNIEVGDLRSLEGGADVGSLAVKLTKEMNRHIVDPDFEDWLTPDFSTTTKVDKVTAAVLMLGAMHKYFAFHMRMHCGIPYVTLLGNRGDWVNIRSRLDKIQKWGKEAEEFATRLKAVLQHFIESFDNPQSDKIREFWGKLVHKTNGGSGDTFLSGWVTAFCNWDNEGRRLGRTGGAAKEAMCRIGSSVFLPVDITDIPPGCAVVPVVVNNVGTTCRAKMVAGSVGYEGITSHESATAPDTLQPVTGWWMYEEKEVVNEHGSKLTILW